MQSTRQYINRLHLIVETSLPHDLTARQCAEQLRDIALNLLEAKDKAHAKIGGVMIDALTGINSAFLEAEVQPSTLPDKRLTVLDGGKKC